MRRRLVEITICLGLLAITVGPPAEASALPSRHGEQASPAVDARTVEEVSLDLDIALGDLGTEVAAIAEFFKLWQFVFVIEVAKASQTVMTCPVPGSFFDDGWGAPRAQGFHRGVDMMARYGVPIYAPVAGFVTYRSNTIGGLAFHLDGQDGRYYYGAHLSSYGKAGFVNRGDVIGYVGNTGDARYTAPHLHLEIHVPKGNARNPYPDVAAVC